MPSAFGRICSALVAGAVALAPVSAAASAPPPAPEASPPPQAPAAAPPASPGAGWNGPLAVKQCTPPAMQLPADTEQALHATLLVRLPDGIGSAVLISPDGFALTAAHVVGNATDVTVVADKGGLLQASVVRVDERQDVALLKVQLLGTTPCLAPIATRAPIGSDVFVLGSPGGEELSFSVAKGIVSGHRDFGGVRFVQLDASVNPGNSGGPVVDQTGAIVGLASWKVSHVSMEGLAFAVPTGTALDALEISLGPKSTDDWAQLGGRRVAGDHAPIGASQPASPATAGSGPATLQSSKRSADLENRKRLRSSLIVPGVIAFGLGVAAVAGTGGYYYWQRSWQRDFADNLDTSDVVSEKKWKALVAVNAVGWTLAGVGLGLFITGIAIPKKPKKKSVAIYPTPGGIGASGRF